MCLADLDVKKIENVIRLQMLFNLDLFQHQVSVFKKYYHLLIYLFWVSMSTCASWFLYGSGGVSCAGAGKRWKLTYLFLYSAMYKLIVKVLRSHIFRRMLTVKNYSGAHFPLSTTNTGTRLYLANADAQRFLRWVRGDFIKKIKRWGITFLT